MNLKYLINPLTAEEVKLIYDMGKPEG